MKKLCSLLLVICLLTGLFSGCTASNRTLFEFQKDEISAAVQRLDGVAVDWKWGYYYGKFDGYHIVMNPGQLAMIGGIRVGDYLFRYGSSFQIYACKNGTAYFLKDAYENGLISDEALAEIYAEHERMWEEKFPAREEQNT